MKNIDERIYYINKSALNHLSYRQLSELIESDDFHHRGKLVSNFETTIEDGRSASKALEAFTDQLVCGHWYTSCFYNELIYKDDKEKQLDVRKDNPIFKSDQYPGLIGLDTCTALTKKVNVLVLKSDEFNHY